jgi:hypothetical protein
MIDYATITAMVSFSYFWIHSGLDLAIFHELRLELTITQEKK